jgi:hypothetical protein
MAQSFFDNPWIPVEQSQQDAGRSLRCAAALLPIADRADRHANAAGERGQPGLASAAHDPGAWTHLSGFGLNLHRAAGAAKGRKRLIFTSRTLIILSKS